MTFYFDMNKETNQSMFSFDNYNSECHPALNWLSVNLNDSFPNEKYEKQSTFAEEGSVNLENASRITQHTLPLTMDSLEQNVKKEIDEKGLDFALEGCLKSKTSEKKKQKKNIRNKQTKTKEQIAFLEEELKSNPKRWNKQERIRIGEKIGLTQIQVYKWYYDNTTGKASQARQTDSKTDLSSELSHKRTKYEDSDSASINFKFD